VPDGFGHGGSEECDGKAETENLRVPTIEGKVEPQRAKFN